MTGVLAMAVVLAGAPTPASAAPPDTDGDLYNSANAYASVWGQFSGAWNCAPENRHVSIIVHEGQTVTSTIDFVCVTHSVRVTFATRDIDPTNGRRPSHVWTRIGVEVFDYGWFEDWEPEVCAEEFFDYSDFISAGPGFPQHELTVSCPGMTFALDLMVWDSDSSEYAACWEDPACKGWWNIHR
jgi:hypothetical protein